MVKRRVARRTRKAPKRVATSRMPNAGLKKFWAAVNSGRVPDPRNHRRRVHRA